MGKLTFFIPKLSKFGSGQTDPPAAMCSVKMSKRDGRFAVGTLVAIPED